MYDKLKQNNIILNILIITLNNSSKFIIYSRVSFCK